MADDEYDSYDGMPPHIPRSDTSIAASADIADSVPALHAVLLGHLARGPMTDEEMQRAANMLANTQRPRRVELVDRGLVCDSGMRRPTTRNRTAVVWQLHRAQCTCSGELRHTARPVARSGEPAQQPLAPTPSDEVIRAALVDLGVLWKAAPKAFGPHLVEVAKWLRALTGGNK